MAEVEATIPENSETITASEAVVEEPAAQAPEAKRGRGRPAGARDKAPRAYKPKVRAEPIPQPVEPKKAAPKPAPEPQTVRAESPPPVERPPSPDPLPRAHCFVKHRSSCSTSGM